MDFPKLARRVALRIVSQDEGGEGSEGQYGGKGPFNLPADHIPAIQVPKGGSNCQNCKFVDAENHACNEPNYITWNGGDPALPDFPLDEICSDWYIPAAGVIEGEAAGEIEEAPKSESAA